MDKKRLLENMERIPVEEILNGFDNLCERIDKEDRAFVLTLNGEDKCVICPYHWFAPNEELVHVEVEQELLDQLKELITPMGLTPERVIQKFLKWCANSNSRDEAVAYLTKLKNEAE